MVRVLEGVSEAGAGELEAVGLRERDLDDVGEAGGAGDCDLDGATEVDGVEDAGTDLLWDTLRVGVFDWEGLGDDETDDVREGTARTRRHKIHEN